MPLDLNALDNAVALADPTTPDATLAAQPGWGTPVVTPVQAYITHRTTLDVFTRIDAANGLTAAEWVANAVQQALPNTAKWYLTPGDTSRAESGLDISNPATIKFVNDMVKASGEGATTPPGLVTQAMADALIALGQTSTYVFGAAVSEADVTASRARNAANATHRAALNAASAVYNAAVFAADEAYRAALAGIGAGG